MAYSFEEFAGGNMGLLFSMDGKFRGVDTPG
jgi:hypothetical protein